MGIRVRKSIKVAPGVKLNVGKKSASVSFGVNGARKTYSTTGRKTTTVGVPGTGVYYSKTKGKNNSNSSNNDNNVSNNQNVDVKDLLTYGSPKRSTGIYAFTGYFSIIVSMFSALVGAVLPGGGVFIFASICFFASGSYFYEIYKLRKFIDYDNKGKKPLKRSHWYNAPVSITYYVLLALSLLLCYIGTQI